MVPTSTARGNPNDYLLGWRVPSQARIFMMERVPKILEFSWQVLIHIIIGSVSKLGRKTSKRRPNGKKTVTHAPTRALERFYVQLLRTRAHAQLPKQSRVGAIYGQSSSRAVPGRAGPDPRAWCVSATGWGRASSVGDHHMSITDSAALLCMLADAWRRLLPLSCVFSIFQC